MHTFAKGDRFWGPIPAFLYDWVGVFVIRPAMFGIMSLSLGTYATQPFYGDCEAPSVVKKLVTVLAMRECCSKNLLFFVVLIFCK